MASSGFSSEDRNVWPLSFRGKGEKTTSTSVSNGLNQNTPQKLNSDGHNEVKRIKEMNANLSTCEQTSQKPYVNALKPCAELLLLVYLMIAQKWSCELALRDLRTR